MKEIFRGKLTKETENSKAMPYSYNDTWFTGWFDTEEDAIEASIKELKGKANYDCTPKEIRGLGDWHYHTHNERLRDEKRNYYFHIEKAYQVHEHVGNLFGVDEKDLY